MKIIKRFARALGVLLTVSIGSQSIIYCYEQTFVDHVATRYATSFGISQASAVRAEEALTGFAQIKALFGKNKFLAEGRSDSEVRTLARSIAAGNPLAANVIDTTLVDKIELVKGEGQPRVNLASCLADRYITTELGRKHLTAMLTQPTNDVTLVKKRQMLLKELVQNEALLSQCKTILATVKGTPESHLLSCLAGDLKNLGTAALSPLTPPSEKLGQSTVASEAYIRGRHLLVGIATVLTSAAAVGTLAKALLSPANESAENDTRIQGYYSQMNQYQRAARESNNFIQSWSNKAKYYWAFAKMVIARPVDHQTRAFFTVVGGLYGFMAFTQSAQIRHDQRTINCLQEYLIGAGTYVTALREASRTLSQNAVFAQNFSALQDLANLNSSNSNHSDKFKGLIQNLSSNTFKGEASCASLAGRITATYNLMKDESVRNEFAPALNAFAELDVLVAIAEKIKATSADRVHYCFAEFSNNATQPYISATNFWNPFVDQNRAVANTFTFGPGNSVHNVILTGSNTGGKSTLLKALMMNEVLAHTFGIAAADKFVTTPFAKLTCHMNITDDTAGGTSLFQAEINRARDLAKMMRDLPANQFAFIIIDEIFTGTAPDQAEELSYEFIKKLSEFKNCIFISATHFKKLIGLEQETAGVCKNFHMGVVADAHGQVTKYTYTITPGPATINNAKQLARENNIFA